MSDQPKPTTETQLPCAFCGGRSAASGCIGGMDYIRCLDCGTTVGLIKEMGKPLLPVPDTIQGMWNRRSQPKPRDVDVLISGPGSFATIQQLREQLSAAETSYKSADQRCDYLCKQLAVERRKVQQAHDISLKLKLHYPSMKGIDELIKVTNG